VTIIAVPAVFNKMEVLPIGHAALGQAEGFEVHPVSRTFVIVGKARVSAADLLQATIEGTHPRFGRSTRASAVVSLGAMIGRFEWRLRKDVLDVGDQQLLVLLFVVQPNLDQLPDSAIQVVAGVREQLGDLFVDRPAVAQYFLDGRTRQDAPARTIPAGAERLVVGIEDAPVAGVIRAVVGIEPFEHDRLEEPGGMAQVPLRGTNVGHRLHDMVLDGQRRADRFGPAPHLQKAPPSCVSIG
jgi:hypothetical protein